MAIVYLDVDDEITTAAARIRTATDLEIALVLPAGSRIATSRINFRLLAHEATGRSRRLAIIAPEASTRALAASAGLPAFATVPEFEAARGGEDEAAGAGVLAPGAGAAAAVTLGAAAAASAAAAGPAGESARDGGAARGGKDARTAGAEGGGPATPATPATPAGPTQTLGPGPAGARPGGRGAVGASTGLAAASATTSRRRVRWPIVAGLLLAVAVVGGTGAAVGYVVLPAATVTLEIAAVPVGPIEFTGTADPAAVAVDPATATIPATRISIPLSATGTFKATGKRVEAAAATGQVRWTNCDPVRSYTIPRGTIARTATGVAFLTQENLFLPVAIIDPPRITCQNRTVDVRAQREGPAGNVAAGTITVVPGSYNDVVIKVSNPTATSGGVREEFPQVTEKDVAAATAALTAQLDAQLAEVAADPEGVPAGATVYPETARRDEAVPSQPPADLVGTEVETFELSLTAEGTVVAADPAPLEEIALARLGAEVPEGMELRAGSEVVEIGEGTVEGQTVRYPVAARAEAYRAIEEAEVRDLVKGKTAAEAEAALAPYGEANVVLWPDWATSVTTFDVRLEVVIVPLPPASPQPSPTPSPPPLLPTEPAASPQPEASPPPEATAAPEPTPAP